MAVMKIYGSLDSPNTLKVLACFFEHDLDFEFIEIDLDAGEHNGTPFLSISPFGQVPVLEDGDVIQFETRAIIRSMAHGYARKLGQNQELIFWDSRKQAVVANWVDVEDHKFEPAVAKLMSSLSGGGAADTVELSRVLDVYEDQLGKAKYLVADKFTIVDVLHLPNLESLLGTEEGKRLVEARPRVSAWCSDILARPAWRKVMETKLRG